MRPAFTLFGLAVKSSPHANGCCQSQSGAGFQPEATPGRATRQQQPGAPSLLSKREISRLALARAILSQGMMRGSPPFCLTGSSSTIRGAKRPFYYLTTVARRRRRRRGQPAPRESDSANSRKISSLIYLFRGTQRRQTAGLSAEPRQRRLAVSPVRPAGK